MTPWVAVIFHNPWYNSNVAHMGETESVAFRDLWEADLYSRGVDLVASGHVHAYERSHPVFKGKLDSCGPVHIVIGDGGNREGLAHDFAREQPVWSAYREASYGHGTLDVVNATHAIWKWHRNQVIERRI